MPATATEITMKEMAAKINGHLESGGAVQVTTYLKSTVYTPKHVGWFTCSKDGNLFVRRGRKNDCLSFAGKLAVGVRFGKYA